jgi:hypothetical protein
MEADLPTYLWPTRFGSAAPTTVPAELPPRPAEPRDPVGVGPLVGSGGPAQGIRPSFTDQRLWITPSPVVVGPIVPLTRADTLRNLLRTRALAVMDSLISLPSDAGRQGDWTVDRNGKKYGIDPGYIRLGNFSIPTAVLAMLPFNVQANPIAMERARRLNSLREEIQTQAARSIRDDEFRKAVNALRERKERERREAAGEDPRRHLDRDEPAHRHHLGRERRHFQGHRLRLPSDLPQQVR